ncbi:hypothetical protein [Gynurincola endophyticus]|uniref:hypothetical protein n=1 Tax=Gynurincola endophyticus TaxID=2479004 RepID=UPI000F8E6998|nr:hypothetical protein [Gynurincola endophyticus]
MAHPIDILNELNEFRVLSQIPRKTPYNVPKGYFDSLFLTVNQQITDQNNKKNPFSAPDSQYFEGLAAAVMSKIRSSDEEVQLNVSKENPYSVPVNYFNTLPQEVLKKVKQPAKVISIQKKLYRWAGAVAAGLLLLLTAQQFLNNNQETGQEKYLTAIEALPTDDLMVFAANQGMDTSTESVVFLYANDEKDTDDWNFDIDESLSEFSTEELEVYLNII